jgi:hypothetical protein
MSLLQYYRIIVEEKKNCKVEKKNFIFSLRGKKEEEEENIESVRCKRKYFH